MSDLISKSDLLKKIRDIPSNSCNIASEEMSNFVLTGSVNREHEIIDIIISMPTVELDKKYLTVPFNVNFDKEQLKGLVESYAKQHIDIFIRHGHWIRLNEVNCKCSVCGGYSGTQFDGVKPTSKYCKNCGAKMDGESD